MHYFSMINCSCPSKPYKPYPGSVASRLATVIYVSSMVMSILYDNSYSPNDSNLKYEIYD